jgi:hypothetical protein
MYTKAKIFNLALGALLLKKRISDTETDVSPENQTLNVHWETALYSTLEDLDLDGTSAQKTAELRETDPNDLWLFAYKYPDDCVFFRRIQTQQLKDVRSTQVPKRIGIHNGEKVIFTNQEDIIIEYIPKDVPLTTLSANVGLAIAYKLALLASPLIAGKGADKLTKQLSERYVVAKTEAQEHDRMENHNFDDDATLSEFVEERTS